MAEAMVTSVKTSFHREKVLLEVKATVWQSVERTSLRPGYPFVNDKHPILGQDPELVPAGGSQSGPS